MWKIIVNKYSVLKIIRAMIIYSSSKVGRIRILLVLSYQKLFFINIIYLSYIKKWFKIVVHKKHLENFRVEPERKSRFILQVIA